MRSSWVPKSFPKKNPSTRWPAAAKNLSFASQVEPAHPAGDRLHDFGMGAHLEHVVFHPEEVHDVVVKTRTRTRSPGRRRPASRSRDEALGKIEVLEARPVEGLDLGRVDAVGERPRLPMGELGRRPAEELPAVRRAVGRVHELRRQPAHVIPELPPQLLLGSWCRNSDGGWARCRRAGSPARNRTGARAGGQ